MKIRWLIALGVLSFLVTMILHAPADRLYGWLTAKADGNALQFHGVHGTLSSGGIAGASLRNKPVLQQMNWKLHPGWLALLRLSADLESRGDLNLKLTLSSGIFGRLRLSDIEGISAVKALLATTGAPPLPVEGQIRLNIGSAQFEKGLPVQVDGLAEVQGLTWTLAKEPLVLGDYNANLTTDDKGVLAQLASSSGPVEMSGEARLLTDRSWDVHVQLKPRSDAPQQMLALVKSLGAPDSSGWYHYRRRGNL